MDFSVIIPARYGSSRLPAKPLLPLHGRPLVLHVLERAQACGAKQVCVATDDQRIADVVAAAGGEVCMTRRDHNSGTDRLAEVVDQLALGEDEVVVNLQGDEPQMPSELIQQVASDMITHADASVTTLYQPIGDRETLFNPNAVKVVTDEQGYALYFSRAPIPWNRDTFSTPEQAEVELHLRHIGLYSYRVGFLRRYTAWSPSPLEQLESLEQLRVLWKGERIHLTEAVQDPGHGIDTAEDLEQAERNRPGGVDAR
ncbi:MAG: 3-deoxy-manno-octulosonate cytidylyltransferase [Gammaproteobacteria bacterium]|jgi:3-deoxy-manno-octulosonate cytidylyltransferase (CMP-KDO synthetase)|nr:3-deoxy-manno-octulosonate cytidylyltransferase [Gammaproteobacteria bacterium]